MDGREVRITRSHVYWILGFGWATFALSWIINIIYYLMVLTWIKEGSTEDFVFTSLEKHLVRVNLVS